MRAVKGTVYIDLLPSEEAYLEVSYLYTPPGIQTDYDVPPDPSETEITKVILWEFSTQREIDGRPKRVSINITSWYERIIEEGDVLEQISNEQEA